MIMGEAMAVQPVQERIPAMEAQEDNKIDVASRIEQRLAEDEEATVEIPTEKNPLQRLENTGAADTDDNSEDAASAEGMQSDEANDTTSDTAAEETPEKEIQAILIEASEMHMICPLVLRIGGRTASIFEERVEMGDFENDEDDLVIDLLKRMYRAGEYFEAMELLQLTFLMRNAYEPVELLEIILGMGDADCCRLFLNGFIMESPRTDLEVLQRAIRRKPEEKDEVGVDD